MAARSRGRPRPAFSRGRLVVGLVLVVLFAVGLAYAFSKLRGGPDAGRLVYAARQGVFERELSTGDDTKLASLPDSVEVAMPSPDGRYVAYAMGEGELWIAALEGDRRFQVAERLVLPLGWSPDSRLVAGELLSDQDLVAIDPDGGREVLLSGGYLSGSQPVWIDADRFAIARNEDTFVIVEAGKASEPIDGRPLAASPDGDQLLFVRGDDVLVGSVEDDRITDEQALSDDGAAFGAASAQGFLAVANDDGVHVFEGGTDSRRVVDRAVDWIGWAHGGAVLLYAHDGAAYALELRAEDPDGEPKRVTRRDADVFPLAPFAVVG